MRARTKPHNYIAPLLISIWSELLTEKRARRVCVCVKGVCGGKLLSLSAERLDCVRDWAQIAKLSFLSHTKKHFLSSPVFVELEQILWHINMFVSQSESRLEILFPCFEWPVMTHVKFGEE